MNIIELFENLNINKDKTLHFTTDEIIRIEKQINVEKKLNADVDVNVAANLVEALRNYPEEFQFIANDRNLYNFFSKKSYYRDHFPKQNIEIDNERVKLFVGRFLEEDLSLFFDKKLTENRFEEMHDLLRHKAYFPEDILYKIGKKGEGKIDFALANLHSENINYSTIQYIKEPYFYCFLSHFSTLELDEKVKSLLNVAVDIYNVNKTSDFAGTAMVSMADYTAFDDDLAETLAGNKKVVLGNRSGSNDTSSSSSSSGFSWRTFFIVIFILVKVALIGSKCSNSSSSSNDNQNYYDDVNFNQIDSYFTESNAKIDTFRTFLTNYDKKKVGEIKYADTMKTGQNPFENMYKERQVVSEKSDVIFSNTTNYDVIVLENELVYDTIKVPSNAYYIKSKQAFNINAGTNKVFNFYVGKKLGSYHQENEKLYVRNHSIVEPRFTELFKNAKDILNMDYQFDNEDVEIVIEHGQFLANRKGLGMPEKSFDEMAKDREKIIEELSKRK